MTGPEIMAVVGFFVMLAGAGWRVWTRVEAKVKVAEDKADKNTADLAAYKLHAAETFATKTSQAEQTAQLLRAIEGVGSRIDGVHERLDRLYENSPQRRTTTRG
ncbi:hypothetical protein ABID08_002051 [Rhizobium binae]|uniref:DUF2730 family protein n=1 Tax=Rhizobium binae TaxID=1138190 RepID=A0ABV2ME02_9HYPH|nr:hypothetical protein [Rhizobium binae]MBX4992881.1 hypothetical protein [Rhizobium binae]NKL52811.1 hypothetical protein [Rhizobium leguminosarum bv. viciae]QSY84178.1 hypothetical protein J2J99_10515 [Rhizobium binae]